MAKQWTNSDNKWTNSDSEIKTWTDGKGIGKVFLKDKKTGKKKEYEVLGKDYKDEETPYIFHTTHGNFHFLPVLEPEKVIDDLKDYLCTVETVRKKLYDKLSLKSYDSISPQTEYCGQINGKFPQAYLDKKSDGITNNFYKRVTVKTNGRFFTINFMRWYVKEENKTINCIMGGIQFDSTEDGYVNSKCPKKEKAIITYPVTRDEQELKGLMSNEVNGKRVYFFHPSVSDIWEMTNGKLEEQQSKLQSVIDEFNQFIEKVNELEKNKA